MIGIIDYKIGNLKNVKVALENLGENAFISSSISELEKADGLILPGVGAFGDGMKYLKELGLKDFLDSWVGEEKFLLGICLGMQLIFEKSYEMGEFDGLGYLKGEIIPFNNGLKVPHMGWNELFKNEDSPLIKGVNDKEYVYFVHSYYASGLDNNNILMNSDYGHYFPAVVGNGNVFGMQFHPEKSGETGKKLLINFLEMTK